MKEEEEWSTEKGGRCEVRGECRKDRKKINVNVYV